MTWAIAAALLGFFIIGYVAGLAVAAYFEIRLRRWEAECSLGRDDIEWETDLTDLDSEWEDLEK